jgi:hypothetical protein
LDGGETYVTAGRPVFTDMTALCQEGLTPSPNVRVMMDNYKFGYLRLHAGFGSHQFLPSPHPMVFGKVTITLSSEPMDKDKPMVFDWQPKDTNDEQKIENEFKVSADFDFKPVKAGIQYSRKTEKIHYKPRVVAIGGQTDKMTWHYSTTDTIGRISGDREPADNSCSANAICFEAWSIEVSFTS